MSGKYSFSDIQDQRREDRRPKKKINHVKIAHRSDKGAKEDRLYNKMNKEYLKENLVCMACLNGCGGKSTHVHHKKGRGIWLLITKYWLAVCANCHKWIEENPAEAKEKGLSLNRIN